MKRFFTKGEKGFTLLELLVVVAILSILAAVAIPNVTSMIRSGNVAAANAELATVETAIAATMANAKTGTVTGTMIRGSPAADITPSVAPYLAGGIGVIKGTYTVDVNGQVTAGSYPGVIGFTSPASHQFS